jgi:transposase-like protein
MGQRRTFSLEEKLDILQQAKQHGITNILHRHNLSYSVFHRWKEKLTEKGKEEIKTLYASVNTKMKDLLEENSLLKKIIANQAMLLEMKEEELRKHNRH